MIPYAFSRVYTSLLDVGTTATPAASKNFLSHQFTGRVEVVVANTSGSTIYWGGSDVTTSTGIPIKDGETVTFPMADGDVEKGVFLVAGAAAQVPIAELTV